MHRFSTKIDVTNDSKSGRAEIVWFLDLEFRDWGIENMLFYCPNQDFSVKYDDGTSAKVHVENVEVDNDARRGCPTSLNIWRGRCILEFGRDKKH